MNTTLPKNMYMICSHKDRVKLSFKTPISKSDSIRFGSIVVSISTCHAEDQGSIPGQSE